MKQKNYRPDPDLSLTRQSEIYHGKQTLVNGGQSILRTAEKLGWPVGCNRK